MYFLRLFQHSKILFALIAAFCLLQGFFTYKGVETFPFFNFGMYSEMFPEKEVYEIFTIKTGGEVFDYESLPVIQRDLLLNTLAYYKIGEENGWNDPIQNDISNRFEDKVSAGHYQHIIESLSNDADDKIAFQQWFKRYLESAAGKEFEKIEIYVNIYQFGKSHEIKLIDNKLLFEI
ncbi:MAG: hypothetical protein COA57_04660 [Flavobacteriales bacterium]|nr:MAG: hypothetical protein COA57_04660 [Flavobacteriales bacterium]